jgi:hypothetical protein
MPRREQADSIAGRLASELCVESATTDTGNIERR